MDRGEMIEHEKSEPLSSHEMQPPRFMVAELVTHTSLLLALFPNNPTPPWLHQLISRYHLVLGISCRKDC